MDRRRFLPSYHYENNTDGVLINSVGKPLRDYKIYGAADGVGDIAVNRIDHTKITSRTNLGLTFANNNDGTFTVNGTITAVTIGFSLLNGVDLNEIEAGEPYYASSGNDLDDNIRRYYFFMQINDRVTGASRYFTTRTATTFTLSENEYISICEIRINSPTGELFEVDNVVFTPILCKASEYGYKIPVKVTGKNILNISDIINDLNEIAVSDKYKVAYETIDGVEAFKLYGSTSNRISFYIDFKTITQYVISFNHYDVIQNNQNGPSVFIYYTDGTRGDVLPSGGNRLENAEKWNAVSFISAAGKTIERLYFSYANGEAYSYFANFQIEEGTTKTEYEEYHGTTANIFTPSQLAENDYIDYINKQIVIDGVATAADLPQIPTQKGTTNIHIETDVSPSAVQYQYYAK